MEIRRPDAPFDEAPRSSVRASFASCISILALSLSLAGCASPGEPAERRPPVPTAVSDLSALQSGNTVALTFTLPRETLEHRLLKQPPDIEIYRSFSAATPPGPFLAPSLVVTIPSALVSHYEQDGQIRYADRLTVDILKQYAGQTASYLVRTRASRKRDSPDSNLVRLPIYAAPEPITDLKAQLAPSAISLTWTAPQQTPLGPAPAIREYRIYRAEISSIASGGQPAARQQEFPMGGARGAAPRMEKIDATETSSYRDSRVEVGGTYQYFVRSVVEYSGQEVESGDSNTVAIPMRDIFPPSAPRGLLAVFVPPEPGTAAHIDLSWDVNPETDVAGYNVYKSEQEGRRGTRLNQQLLPTPAFSDMSTVAGQRYFYRVTAVDRSGNESTLSEAVAGEVPTESQP